MNIFLLTHKREYDRKTNTGSLAVQYSNGIVESILWDRVNPNKKILDMLEKNEALLMYPKSDSEQSNIEEYENIIVLDGTWQEAQKIYNKSPYLKSAPKAMLYTTKTSDYKLRRNQPDGGLCTIECVIEILNIKGHNELASKLKTEFEQFNGNN